MTSPNSSNKRRKLRRHASLSAFNLGLAGISVATLAIFIFLQQIQGGRLELVKAPSPQTSYYLAEYHQGYLILFAIIAMQAIVTATYSLRFIHGRRSSTTDQSPPVSRDRLFLSKYLAGLIAATVPFLAYMAILVIANVQAFGYSSQMAQAALLLAAAGFTAVFSVYSIASVVCLMAGTSAKGMAFSVFLMFGPYFILNSTTSIFKFFLHGNAFGAVNNYFGTTMPSLFDHVSPYLPGWGMIPFLEKYSYSTGTWGSRLGGAFILAAWILLSILASALALRLFKRDKAERAGVTGQAGCMGTLFCFTVAYAMFGLVFTMINTSGFDLLLYGTMAFIASFLVCKLILARDVEIAFKFKTLGQLLASAAITAAACVICATGLFGYASYQPNLDEIESASITYAGAPDFLIGESGEFGSYKYPDLDGDYLEWVFRDFSDLEYSSKSDLRTVLDIHKILIDEKPRLLGNSSDALTDQIHVTYRLANGGKVERQYKLIMPDASLELLRLDSTEAVKQRISETFATLLDAELSPFLVTDSLFQNELEPSHADAKRLLSAFLEDSSERTIESKYFPDKLCRAIISFPRISPDGGVETLKTEPRTIVEASIKDNPSNLNLASKSTSVMRLYITDDCVRTLEVLRSIGMLDSDPSVENIESMDINVYSVKGFYFRSYGDEIEPEGLLDMSPSDFKSLLNVSRSSYYAAKGGYIVKVGMRGNDFWTTLFIPEDVAPGYLKFQSS